MSTDNQKRDIEKISDETNRILGKQIFVFVLLIITFLMGIYLFLNKHNLSSDSFYVVTDNYGSVDIYDGKSEGYIIVLPHQELTIWNKNLKEEVKINTRTLDAVMLEFTINFTANLTMEDISYIYRNNTNPDVDMLLKLSLKRVSHKIIFEEISSLTFEEYISNPHKYIRNIYDKHYNISIPLSSNIVIIRLIVDDINIDVEEGAMKSIK